MNIACFSIIRTKSELPRQFARGMILMVFILSFSFSAQPLLGTQTFAVQERLGARGDYDVVTGYIQEVSNDNIKVQDHYYNIENIPLKNNRGREISKAALTNGAKVEVRHKRGVVKGLTFIQGYSIE
jgi:hypothetical protein